MAPPAPESSFPMFLSGELCDGFQDEKYNSEASQPVSRFRLGTYAELRAVDATGSRRSSSDHPCGPTATRNSLSADSNRTSLSVSQLVQIIPQCLIQIGTLFPDTCGRLGRCPRVLAK